MTLDGSVVIERFADGLDHPEGLAFSSDGSLWAGGEAGQVYRIDTGGAWAIVGETGGSCLGLAVDREDAVYICDRARSAVLRRHPGGAIDVFAERVGDRLLVGPNFPVFGSDGSLYVSCSGGWGAADGWIARFPPDGPATVMLSGLDLANGLAIDAAGEFLYVVETHADRIRRLPADGSGRPELVIEGLDRLPDGLAFAVDGSLFITCYASDRIYRLAPDGCLTTIAEDRESIALSHPTNCAFGGPAFDELYVACYGLRHISRLKVAQSGQRLYGGLQA